MSEETVKNYFGNKVLEAFHKSKESFNYKYDSISSICAALDIVLDEETSQDEKNKNAIIVGDLIAGSDWFGRERNRNYFAIDWYKYAFENGSIEGITKKAKSILSEGLFIEKNVFGAYEVRDSTDPKAWVDRRELNSIISEMESGVRSILKRPSENFDIGNIYSSIDCIVFWVSIISYKASSLRFENEDVNDLAMPSWLDPLWNFLVSKVCDLETDISDENKIGEHLRLQKIETIEIHALHLNDFCDRKTKPEKEITIDQIKCGVKIILGEIPPSTDKDDRAFFKRYDALKRNVKLAALPDEKRLNEILDELRHEFPWNEAAAEAVMAELFARSRLKSACAGLLPILLVGKPASGKTRFTQRLSDLLGIPNTVINLAGISDAKVLKGSSRGWAGNRASKIVDFIESEKVANPLFILDELDKTGNGMSSGGDPQEVLLDLLDPRNAKRFHDVFLLTECDLSHCMYIATANDVRNISPALISRLRIIDFDSPTEKHRKHIAKIIAKDLEKQWQLPDGSIDIETIDFSQMVGCNPRSIRFDIINQLSGLDFMSFNEWRDVENVSIGFINQQCP